MYSEVANASGYGPVYSDNECVQLQLELYAKTGEHTGCPRTSAMPRPILRAEQSPLDHILQVDGIQWKNVHPGGLSGRHTVLPASHSLSAFVPPPPAPPPPSACLLRLGGFLRAPHSQGLVNL